MNVHRPPRPLVLLLLPALLGVLLTGAPARADAGALTVTGSTRLTERLWELTTDTPALDFPATVRVLLPDGYEDRPDRRYPVLYLLHGSFDTAASWTDKGDAERLTAGLPLIVVMPAAAGKGDAGGWASDWRNEGRGGPPKWATFTIDQLIPWVDGHYRTRAERGGRAIAGLSMGGFSAMSYAVRHPDLFAAAASFSGAVDTNHAAVQPVIQLETLADGGATPDAIWGPRSLDAVYWRGHNPWDLAANLRGMTLSIRTGDGGPPPGELAAPDPIEIAVHDMSLSLHRRLDALDIPHVFDDYGPGTHSWSYWQRDLRLELPRLMTAFDRAPAAPGPVTYTSIEPQFEVHGWRVTIDRARTEFATLAGADVYGFTLRGSGSGEVTTPPRYGTGSAHTVTVDGGAARTLRADAEGRLHIAVPLGPANACQQYRPPCVTRTYAARVTIS
jgi:S-formylglutathione hydrolase FrmB